jgi:malonyl-CoA/methylmalonyl-CoA synthetase
VTAPLPSRAALYPDHAAIIAGRRAYTYGDLDLASKRVAAGLLNGARDLSEARIAYQIGRSFEHVAVQWGIWRAGGIAVPLAESHPASELDYALRDAQASTVVADVAYAPVVRPIAHAAGLQFIDVASLLRPSETAALPEVSGGRRALLLYTSGTTAKPKGVVHTHDSINAQITSLVEAWEWSSSDRILLVLPLHHVHGIVNVVCCALWAGATCELIPTFDAELTWDRLASGELTLFMAVPTIYHKLIAAWDAASSDLQRVRSRGCADLRLMVSGSAALPVQTLERWRQISGHVLLERYGMTEIGMALSNPLHGERRPGFVGRPLPGVAVRLVDDYGAVVRQGTPGEIEVQGRNVFAGYWQRPEETSQAFRGDWFRTGDLAVVDEGYYRILGRTSVDIIKTGGYKVSALEIEEALRLHPAITECAVVGVSDDEWGERVCAAVELRADATLPLSELQHWARERLAPYKIPRALQCLSSLPRNAMGKVVKPEVARLFSANPSR